MSHHPRTGRRSRCRSVCECHRTTRRLKSWITQSLWAALHRPLLPTFLTRYPQLSLQLNFDDRYADLIDRRFDVAVRIGNQFSGQFISRKLASNPRHVCASPDYLARYGAPRIPTDLASHDCLHFSPLIEPGRWRLSRNGETVEAAIRAVITADNAEALRQAALAGVGLTVLADFLIGEDLRAGRLVAVLTDWTAAESDIHVIYPDARYLPLKTRVFVDYLVGKIGVGSANSARRSARRPLPIQPTSSID